MVALSGQWTGRYKSAYSTSSHVIEAWLFVEIRRSAYRELFQGVFNDEAVIHAIRETINHALVLGRSYFKDKIEAMTKRQT
jgi:hypothetical protein